MSNPIIERELIGLLRTRKALAMLVGAAAAFALLVIVRWPTDAQVDLAGSQSRKLFDMFAYGILTLIIVLVPVFPAASIVRETRSGTLALLLNSPMSVISIYFGKLLGVLGFVLLLLIVSLPAAMACYVMGGLSLVKDVLVVYGLVIVAAVQYSTLGLLISTYARTSDSALRITYGGVLVMSILVLGPYQFLHGLPGILTWLATLLRNVSPIPALMEVLGHGDLGSQGIMAVRGAPMLYLILAAVTIAVFMAVTITRLNYRIFDQARSAGTITDEQTLGVRAVRRMLFLVDPKRRKAGIGMFTNPLMVKGIPLPEVRADPLAAANRGGLRAAFALVDRCHHAGDDRLGRGEHRRHHGRAAGGSDRVDHPRARRRIDQRGTWRPAAGTCCE